MVKRVFVISLCQIIKYENGSVAAQIALCATEEKKVAILTRISSFIRENEYSIESEEMKLL